VKYLHKIKLLFNTVKYLKPTQVYYRLFYFARRRVRRVTGVAYPLSVTSTPQSLILKSSIASYTSSDEEIFTFLNLSHAFENGIDWNFSEFGKLWTYNLTYFDYLQQEGMSKEKGMELIYDFIDQLSEVKDGLEPFPISLRGINWVKFLIQHQIKEQKIDDSLYAQYQILMDNLEYHLLGNHLLENGFSLLFGAYYFQDEKLYAKAKEILTVELEEQILDDGAHFELSPMYHQIMLFRVLDCLNLVQNNRWMGVGGDELMGVLEEKASLMLKWLNVVTFEDGSIPLLNDSANGIAPTTEQLCNYALQLSINQSPMPRQEMPLGCTNYELRDSGYRKITKPRYECIIDIGYIGPDYIPGHAHADTFNFELHINNKAFIVDTGLSTYETNVRRTEERATASHNTVEVNKMSSSEVWGGFRVADRAYVSEIFEKENEIMATHNGYEKKFGLLHTRTWSFEEDKIIIKDSLNKTGNAIARFHFHPSVTKEMIEQSITLHQSRITNDELPITNYQHAPEFNKLVDALVLEIPFEKDLTVEITL